MEYLIFLLAFVSFLLIGVCLWAVFIFGKLLKKNHKPDFFALFVFGIVWTFFCLFLELYYSSAIGILSSGFALRKRKSWKKNNLNWEKMNKNERSSQLMLLGILIFLFVSFWGIYLLLN